VLAAMGASHADSFVAFVRSRSQQIHKDLLARPWKLAQQARYEAMAEKSRLDQRAIEASDTMPFEIYRLEYVSAARLGRSRVPQEVAA
jgi:glutamate--cysteine ligase